MIHINDEIYRKIGNLISDCTCDCKIDLYEVFDGFSFSGLLQVWGRIVVDYITDDYGNRNDMSYFDVRDWEVRDIEVRDENDELVQSDFNTENIRKYV